MVLYSRFRPSRYTNQPNSMAMTMYTMAEKATAGSAANVCADSSRKTAITRVRANQVKTRNNFFAGAPIHSKTTSPTDRPLCRREATREPMS